MRCIRTAETRSAWIAVFVSFGLSSLPVHAGGLSIAFKETCSQLAKNTVSATDGKPAQVSTVSELRRTADAGNADAQCNLGVMYAGGQSVGKDIAEAVR